MEYSSEVTGDLDKDSVNGAIRADGWIQESQV
jgi:hypothetical protein